MRSAQTCKREGASADTIDVYVDLPRVRMNDSKCQDLGLLFLRICVRPLVERMAAWGSIRLLSRTVGTAFE